MHAGLTGTAWWADIFRSQLPPLGGDGSVATSFGTTSTTNADACDTERSRVSLAQRRRAALGLTFARRWLRSG